MKILNPFLIPWICAFLMACTGGSGNEASFDKNARRYRMYYDQAGQDNAGRLQVKKFDGQIRLAGVKNIFGDLAELREDNNKNRVGGWKLHDGLLWSIVAGPGLKAINIMTVDLDGTINSTLDLDGDSIADIVDIRPPDGGRFSFVTERLGREVFERWLLGQNPLCNEMTIAGLDLPVFGCDDTGSGSSGGDTADPYGGAGIYDPFDHLCDEYSTRPGPRPPVMAHGGHGYGRLGPWGWVTNRREDGSLSYTEGTRIYRDDQGNHVATYRTTTYYDEDGNVTRVMNERVDHEGNGTRRITDYGADGSTKTTEESFETEVHDDGYFDSNASDYEPGPRSGEDPNTGTTDPGPGGDPGDPNAGMAEWCANRGDFVSGVERAAGTDHTSFNIDCDDLVRQSNASGNCAILEWARPGDFTGALDAPAAGTNCGPFEQPGPDGTCGAASGIQRLRGNAAWFGSLDLEVIEICNPLVCNPGI